MFPRLYHYSIVDDHVLLEKTKNSLKKYKKNSKSCLLKKLVREYATRMKKN